MLRRTALVLLFLTGSALAATPGESLAQALKKKDVKTSVRLLGTEWKYGAAGKDAPPGAPLEKFLAGLFKAFGKTFADTPVESYDCTQAGRELAYMATQWAQDDASVAEWLRRLPDGYCTDPTAPPGFWFVKRLDTDRPHALIVVESTGDSPKVLGFYHF